MTDYTSTRPAGSPGPEHALRIIALLATIVLVNPAALFLVTHSLAWAAGLTALAIAVTQAALEQRRHRLVKAYAFNVLAVLSFFLHGEVILTKGFPEHVVENLYQIRSGYYFNWPHLNQQFRDKEYAVTYRTNAQGLRIGSDQDPERRVESADWLVLGDSFTQGAQVEFEDLYTTLLYRRFPSKIVLNAGISGFGIGHEHNYFVAEGARFRPELVILQLSSFNDFMNVEPSLVGFSDRLMTYSAFVRLLLANFKFRNPHELPLGRWTEPFQQGPRANADYNIFYNASSERKQRDWQTLIAYLEKMKAAVERSGARLLVVLIPTKEQVYPHYLEEVQRALAIQSTDLDMLRPNRQMRQLTQELRIDFLDLLDSFKGSQGRVFFDFDEHMNATGHRVMADAIAGRLQRQPQRSVAFLSRQLSGDRYPSVSADGMLLAYQALRDRNMELFVARPDLEQSRRLTFNAVDDSHPFVFGDQVIFTQGSAETHRTDVVAMRLDGSARVEITAGDNVFGAIPAVSPTDGRIAYAEWMFEDADKRLTSPSIVLLDRATGQKTYVSQGADAWRPAFSRDGRLLAYIAKVDGRYDVFVHDLRESRRYQVTKTPFDEWDPTFTPDGQNLVYAAYADGNWDLFMTSLDTAQVSRLTTTRGDEWDPAVSADGNDLFFAGKFGLIDGLFRMQLR